MGTQGTGQGGMCWSLQHADMLLPQDDTYPKVYSKSASMFNRNTCLKLKIQQGRTVLGHIDRQIKILKLPQTILSGT